MLISRSLNLTRRLQPFGIFPKRKRLQAAGKVPMNIAIFRPSLLNSLSRRFLHQDYYHPHDVPTYQTPTLGGKGPLKKGEFEIVYPYTVYDARYDISKQEYKSDQSDFDHRTIVQQPEIFLPEEPTFLEFWGFYPFALFYVTFLFSHEFLTQLTTGITSGIFIFTGFIVYFGVRLALSNLKISTMQVLHDEIWCKDMCGEHYLKKALEGMRRQIKNGGVSEEFKEYQEKLPHYKIAYYNQSKNLELKQEITERLEKIKRSEKTYLDSLEMNRTGLEKKAIAEFEKDSENFTQWDQTLFKNMKVRESLQGAKELGKRLDDYVKRNNAIKNQDKKSISAVDLEGKRFYKKILEAMRGLKVFKWKEKIPEKHVLNDTGLFEELSAQQKETAIPRLELISQRKKILDQQIARFQEGKVPEELLKERARLGDEGKK